MEREIKNPCALCGRQIPLDETQLTICTKKKGIEAVCLMHEGEQALKDYVAENGGVAKITDWLSPDLLKG